MDAIVKELDKRAIRVLISFLATHPEGLSKLNDFGGEVLKEGGERRDHKSICEVGEAIIKTMGGDADFQGKDLAAMAELIQSWGDVKLGELKGSDLVRRRCERTKTKMPEPGSDEYNTMFTEELNQTFAALEAMGTRAMREGSKKLRATFEDRAKYAAEAARAAPGSDEWKLAAAKCHRVDRDIRHRMTAMAAWYKKLGGHLGEAHVDENVFKETFREAFRHAGATKDDVRRSFRDAGLGGPLVEKVAAEFPEGTKLPDWQPSTRAAPAGPAGGGAREGALWLDRERRPSRLTRRLPRRLPAGVRRAA
jgi:hypothetical protein